MSLQIINPGTFTYGNELYDTCITSAGEVKGKLDNTSNNSGYLYPVTVENHLFHDIAITCGANVPELEKDALYHLAFDVGQLYLPNNQASASGIYASDTQNFTIKLENSDKTGSEEDSYQNLKNLNIAVPNRDGLVHCELLFSPNQQYNKIVFSLTRKLLINGGDIGLEWPLEGALGRRMSIYNVVLKKVNNLVGKVSGLTGPFGQFELTAPAGTFFSLEKEEIRVGKTGKYIFDLVDWNDFNFFGLVPSSNSLPPETIKLQYEQR